MKEEVFDKVFDHIKNKPFHYVVRVLSFIIALVLSLDYFVYYYKVSLPTKITKYINSFDQLEVFYNNIFLFSLFVILFIIHMIFTIFKLQKIPFSAMGKKTNEEIISRGGKIGAIFDCISIISLILYSMNSLYICYLLANRQISGKGHIVCIVSVIYICIRIIKKRYYSNAKMYRNALEKDV